MAIDKELEKNIRSAAHWSIGTWHHDEYRDLKILSVTNLVGPLYHVAFSVTTHVPITVNALFLNLPDPQPSLFLDSDTIAWLAEYRMLQFEEALKSDIEHHTH